MDLDAREKANHVVNLNIKMERLDLVIKDASKVLSSMGDVKVNSDNIALDLKEIKEHTSHFKKMKESSENAANAYKSVVENSKTDLKRTFNMCKNETIVIFNDFKDQMDIFKKEFKDT